MLFVPSGQGPRGTGPSRPGAALTPFYVAGALLVLAQNPRHLRLDQPEADFVFAGIMIVLVVAALASGADGVYSQLH